MSKSKRKAVKKKAPPKKRSTKKIVAKKVTPKKTKKKESPKKKAAPRVLGAEVQILWKAYCETQQKYVSKKWTTKEEAENEAQPHIDANHQVRYDQNISG